MWYEKFCWKVKIINKIICESCVIYYCLLSTLYTNAWGSNSVIINNNNHTGRTNLALQNLSLIGHQDDLENNLKLIDLQVVGFNKRLSVIHICFQYGPKLEGLLRKYSPSLWSIAYSFAALKLKAQKLFFHGGTRDKDNNV